MRLERTFYLAGPSSLARAVWAERSLAAPRLPRTPIGPTSHTQHYLILTTTLTLFIINNLTTLTTLVGTIVDMQASHGRSGHFIPPLFTHVLLFTTFRYINRKYYGDKERLHVITSCHESHKHSPRRFI